MADPFNVPRTGGGLLALRRASSGPMGLGSVVEMRIQRFGVEWKGRAEITEWDPPRTLAVQVTGAGFRPSSGRLTFEATADGTRVTIQQELKPVPILKPLYWIAWPLLTRQWHAMGDRMRRILEA